MGEYIDQQGGCEQFSHGLGPLLASSSAVWAASFSDLSVAVVSAMCEAGLEAPALGTVSRSARIQDAKCCAHGERRQGSIPDRTADRPGGQSLSGRREGLL